MVIAPRVPPGELKCGFHRSTVFTFFWQPLFHIRSLDGSTIALIPWGMLCPPCTNHLVIYCSISVYQSLLNKDYHKQWIFRSLRWIFRTRRLAKVVRCTIGSRSSRRCTSEFWVWQPSWELLATWSSWQPGRHHNGDRQAHSPPKDHRRRRRPAFYC